MESVKKNCLKPLLFVVLGLTIATIVFAAHFDVSTPPGRPNVYNIESHSCTVSFEEPLDDGGAPIIRYIVEGMPKETGKWERKATPTKLYCVVLGMTEGSEVKFRVIAVNAAGRSKPSVESDFVTFKNPY